MTAAHKGHAVPASYERMRLFRALSLPVTGHAHLAFIDEFCRTAACFKQARAVEPNVEAASLLRLFILGCMVRLFAAQLYLSFLGNCRAASAANGEFSGLRGALAGLALFRPDLPALFLFLL